MRRSFVKIKAIKTLSGWMYLVLSHKVQGRPKKHLWASSTKAIIVWKDSHKSWHPVCTLQNSMCIETKTGNDDKQSVTLLYIEKSW